VTECASSTTWSLVTISPAPLTTIPVPVSTVSELCSAPNGDEEERCEAAVTVPMARIETTPCASRSYTCRGVSELVAASWEA
jgi:hypothetical protein